jgi:hypothetical protein
MISSSRSFPAWVLRIFAWTVVAANAAYGQKEGKRLTIAEVVRLLRAGTPEKDILAAIRTRPAIFDDSDRARARFDRTCAAIKPSGVGVGAWATEVKDIWEAMENAAICRETNGRGGEDGCDLSSRRSSPGK